ncbi:MAG: peptidylprolyl isomerase [Anaerolineales bacterium]|nr:peptidylprolyl isomerase [Anaerolineales bacterium]
MAKNNPKPSIASKKHIARLERERRQTRLIRYVAIGIFLSIILILTYGYLDLHVFALQKPVAIVNGENISIQEFQGQAKMKRAELVDTHQQYVNFASYLGIDLRTDPTFGNTVKNIELQLFKPQDMGKELLDNMIDDRLIRQEAEKMGITISSAELEKEIQKQMGYFPDGTPTPTRTPTTIVEPTLSPKTLALITPTFTPTAFPTSTPGEPGNTPTATPGEGESAATPTVTSTPLPTVTPSPFTADLYQERMTLVLDNLSNNFGVQEQDYRAYIESSLYKEKVKESITSDIGSLQDQVWVRHILLKNKEDADKLYQRLQKGEDFAELAKELSEDTGSGANGGDVGWFGANGNMVEPFKEASFRLEVGEISEPVMSQFGYHLIQVLAHEMRPINTSEQAQLADYEFEKWLDQVREEADIERFDDRWPNFIPTEPAAENMITPLFPEIQLEQ